MHTHSHLYGILARNKIRIMPDNNNCLFISALRHLNSLAGWPTRGLAVIIFIYLIWLARLERVCVCDFGVNNRIVVPLIYSSFLFCMVVCLLSFYLFIYFSFYVHLKCCCCYLFLLLLWFWIFFCFNSLTRSECKCCLLCSFWPDDYYDSRNIYYGRKFLMTILFRYTSISFALYTLSLSLARSLSKWWILFISRVRALFSLSSYRLDLITKYFLISCVCLFARFLYCKCVLVVCVVIYSVCSSTRCTFVFTFPLFGIFRYSKSHLYFSLHNDKK